jgi:UDP-N-acetylmuramate dehydrogenase
MERNMLENIPLSNHCTWAIGGPAKFFATAQTTEDLKQALLFAKSKKIPYFVLGKGSNCLFDDRGFNGLVILNRLDWIQEISPGTFHAGAGTSFALLGIQTAKKGWSGLEFASGIPASVGGAVAMNAGAGQMETKDTLTAVEFLTVEGDILNFNAKDLPFSYRTSPFQKMDGIIISATFTLTASSEAKSKQKELVNYRIQTQPYGEKTCGCVFQNPPGRSAGALIESCGLKGTIVGGAKVSEKHANFLTNHNGATGSDIKKLIEKVKVEVKEKTGIELQLEVKLIPYDGIPR